MPFDIDARTILLAHGVLLVSVGLAFVIASKMMRQFGSLMLWSASCGLQGLGFLFMAWRGLMTPVFSVLLANSLVIIGIAVLPYAVAQDLGVKFKLRHLLYLVVTGLLLFVLTYMQAEVNLRMAAGAGTLSIILLWAAWLTWQYLQRGDRLSMVWGIFVPLALMGGAMGFVTLKLLYQWLFLPPITETYLGQAMLDHFSTHGFIHLLGIFLVTGINFSVIITVAARLNRDLEHMAHHDALTGLLNRYMFFDVASQMLALQGRSGGGSVLLFLDLDYFKKINDLYGHAAGDAVLRRFSDVLREQLRLSDVVGRYGGEEFCVLLPSVSVSQAIQTAERLAAMTRDIKMPWQDKVITVTVSIGVAVNAHSDEGLESMIMRADAALYQAKRSGRNKIVVAPLQLSPAFPAENVGIAEGEEAPLNPNQAKASWTIERHLPII